MNETNGLPTLEDKSIELCYTDYPWGSNMKSNIRHFHDRILDNNKNKCFFDDSLETITREFTLSWFEQVDRVCRKIVLLIPESHKKFWYRNTDPIADVPVIWKNGFSSSKIANKSRKSTYLFFGKFEKGKKLKYDYLAKRYNHKGNPIIEPYTLEWGFCSKERHFKHPSPKGIKIALDILKQLKPENLLDPFAGSGSFLKASSILNIPYLGYEINPLYKQDIDLRFSKKLITEWCD